MIGKFQGNIFTDLCRFQVWTWFIALFSAEFRPCFTGCDGGRDGLLFEDGADSTGRADFSACRGVDAVGDDGFDAGGGVGGDLGGGEFVFFFVGPVGSRTKGIRWVGMGVEGVYAVAVAAMVGWWMCVCVGKKISR
jgi:hypothetical protein